AAARFGGSSSDAASASKKTLYAAEQQRAEVARARRRWMREQGMLDPARLVFIDETCTTTSMVRLRGRCLRGERLIGYARHGQWRTITFVAGLRHRAMVAPFVMIDYFNRKGGIEGYQIEPVYADAPSKPEVAINEVVRLIEQEKVDILLGFFSSAQCVPVAARVDQVKKFMWITTCISSAVLENRHLKYVFRAQPSGRQFGLASTGFVAAYSRVKFGKAP